MTTYTAPALEIISSLAAHGACIRTDDGDRPVTVELYEEFLAEVRSIPACVSATYALVLPGIDAEFLMLVSSNGLVDVGSPESIAYIVEHR